jgi:ketosteroid isomerase-like protein
MTNPETIVGEIYDAWRAQDLEWPASYLPDDFCHIIHIPQDIHPLGGTCRGKAAAIARLGVIADDFEFLQFDTSGLIVHADQAGAEIPIRYRHRETGTALETTIVNFWTFEDGWPIKLAEYHDIERIQAFSKHIAEVLPGPRTPGLQAETGRGRSTAGLFRAKIERGRESEGIRGTFGGKMAESISAILEDYYDAWRAQDLDWLATYLPSDFRHTMHIPHAIYTDGGTLQGKAHVMERWRRYVPLCEFLRYDFSAFLVGKDIAAVEISLAYRHRETGVTLKTTKANIWVFEAGWPIGMTEYYDLTGVEALTRSLGLHGGSRQMARA